MVIFDISLQSKRSTSTIIKLSLLKSLTFSCTKYIKSLTFADANQA